MTDPLLKMVRDDLISKRVDGAPGGHKILFTTKQRADLVDRGMALSEAELRVAAQQKFAEYSPDFASVRSKLLASSMLSAGDGQSSGSNAPWVFCITAPVVDH